MVRGSGNTGRKMLFCWQDMLMAEKTAGERNAEDGGEKRKPASRLVFRAIYTTFDDGKPKKFSFRVNARFSCNYRSRRRSLSKKFLKMMLQDA